tara:strand:- start:1 stop:309 length:309 start_codon:yes stop_codon:yes gene_type:complete
METGDYINSLHGNISEEEPDVNTQKLMESFMTCCPEHNMDNVKLLNYTFLGLLLFLILSLPQTINFINSGIPFGVENMWFSILVRGLLFALTYFVISSKYFH